jgi:SSS family solute:Na+ symporter/sodium/pantothenate symporter
MLRDMMAGSTFVYWLVVLVLVALVAAIMSTSDSALLSIQSMVTKDIYKPYIKPGATPRHLLWSGKLFGWGLMALLVSQAWLSQHFEMSIWQLIKLKLEFMVQISPVFLLGVYWRRLTAGPVLLGVCTGTAITLVLWVGALFGFWGEAMKSPWGISAGVWGLAANYAICIAGGLFSPQAEPVGAPQGADA